MLGSTPLGAFVLAESEEVPSVDVPALEAIVIPRMRSQGTVSRDELADLPILLRR